MATPLRTVSGSSGDPLAEAIELTRRLKLPHIRRALTHLIPTAKAQRWDPAEEATGGTRRTCAPAARAPRSPLLDEFRQRDVAFRFLEQGIDTTTAEGRTVYRMLAAVAEFQRDLIVANTNEGLAAARARGRKGGRRPKLSAHQGCW